jgi:hypothetical protein
VFDVELAVVAVPVQEAEIVQVPALLTAYWSVKLPVAVELTV